MVGAVHLSNINCANRSPGLAILVLFPCHAVSEGFQVANLSFAVRAAQQSLWSILVQQQIHHITLLNSVDIPLRMLALLPRLPLRTFDSGQEADYCQTLYLSTISAINLWPILRTKRVYHCMFSSCLLQFVLASPTYMSYKLRPTGISAELNTPV